MPGLLSDIDPDGLLEFSVVYWGVRDIAFIIESPSIVLGKYTRS